MEKIIKLIMVSFLALGFLGCDQDDAIVNTIYDNINGQTGVGFVTLNSSVIIPEEGIVSTVIVQATTLSTTARTFNVVVDESSTGSSQDYNIGSLTIPADSYEGTLEVTFGNFDNIVDLVAFTLVLNLDLPEGVAIVGSESTTFNYLKKIICNDFLLVINEDGFASERDWEITDDATGTVVAECANFGCPFPDVSGGAQSTANFILPDGCYTFTIFDSFGDGLFDGVVTGNYTLSCSIIIHVTGSGNFGSSRSTAFCVNQ